MKRFFGSFTPFYMGAFLFLMGCGDNEEQDFVARVGDRYLTQHALQEAISTLPRGLNGSEAKRQVIESWVSNALLAQEAQKRKLADNPMVKSLIEESTRSVLIGALLDKVNEESLPEPTPTEIATYYQQNINNLLLKEDYVRIWYIRTNDKNKAESAKNEMTQALKQSGSTAETAWKRIANSYADDKEAALTMSYHYLPESRFEDTSERVLAVLSGLKNNEVSEIENIGGTWHVIGLVERAKTGSKPKLAWIQNEIRQQLRIRAKKQRYATFLQELRSKAMSQKTLEIKGE